MLGEEGIEEVRGTMEAIGKLDILASLRFVHVSSILSCSYLKNKLYTTKSFLCPQHEMAGGI
jgi:hypothetical protein